MSRQYLSTKELAAYDQISKKCLGMFHACYLLQPRCAIRGLHEQFANDRLLPRLAFSPKLVKRPIKLGFTAYGGQLFYREHGVQFFILLMEGFNMEKRSLAQLFDLTGKAAIVTGGAMGIGQASALRLAEAGAAVMIADLNLQAAQQTVEQIVSTGGKAAVLQADASSVSDATKVAQMTVATFGTVDILVNNAAARSIAPIMDLSEAQWERVINTDLKGVFFYAQAAAREMIKG